MEHSQPTMTDWSLIIASIALGLSLWANYSNFRSAVIHLISDCKRFKHALDVRIVHLGVKRYGRDHVAAAVYLNSKPKMLAAEVLDRICDGLPGVAMINGPTNRIIGSMLHEDASDLAKWVHKYYRAQEAHDKTEMDKMLGIFGAAAGFFVRRYHPVLQVSCALNIHMPSRVGGVIVAVGLEHIGDEYAQIGWDVSVDEPIPAQRLAQGVIELTKLENGFWRMTDFRLRT